MDNIVLKSSNYFNEAKSLKPNAHLACIYRTRQEWEVFASAFVKSGLEKGEKCCYIFDTHNARQVRDVLKKSGVDIKTAESSGQLVLWHGNKVYLEDDRFNPDKIIEFIVKETDKALTEGYSAFRITREMEWLLQSFPGSESVLECEAKLNLSSLAQYPYMLVCQYEQDKLSLEFIEKLVLTHPILILNNQICSNFYYVTPEDPENKNTGQTVTRSWLDNIERESLKSQRVQDTILRLLLAINKSEYIVLVVNENGRYVDVNQAALDFFECKREELVGKSVWEIAPFEVVERQQAKNISLFDPQIIEENCQVHGKTKQLRLNIVPVILGNDKHIYALGQDMNPQK